MAGRCHRGRRHHGHTVLGLFTGFLLWFTAGLLAYWHLAWTLPDEVLETED